MSGTTQTTTDPTVEPAPVPVIQPVPAPAPPPSSSPLNPATAPAPTTDPGPTATDPNLVIGNAGTLDLSAIVNQLALPGLSGDTLTLVSATAAEGTIEVNKDGTIDYKPVVPGSQTPGYTITPTNGGTTTGTTGSAQTVATDTITYTITDQLGDTVQGTASITVDPGPQAATGVYTIGHNQSANLSSYLASLISPGLPGDTETVTSVTATAGEIETSFGENNGVPDGTYHVEYTAPSSGDATLTYTATDQYGDTASANVAIVVDPGPIVTNPTLVIQQVSDGAGQLDLSQFVNKLATPGLKGDTLTLTSVSGTHLDTISTGANGDIIYANKLSLQTDTFNYTVADQYGDTAQGTVSILLDPGPTASNGTLTIGHGQQENITSYLQSLVTPGISGDQENIVSVNSQFGTVSETSYALQGPSGTSTQTEVDYTAPATGTDTLSYTVADQNGVKATGSVAVTVDPGPTAANGAFTVGHGETTNLSAYLAGLITPGLPGDTETITALSVTEGSASVEFSATDGQYSVQYTAPGVVSAANDSATLSYTVTDQYGDAATGSVALTIDPGPTTSPLSATVQLGQSIDLTSAILGSDNPGLAGDRLTIISDSTAHTLGSVTLNGGDLVYSATGSALASTAATGTADDSFTYVVADQNGGFATGTVNIAVTDPVTVINGGPYGGSTIQGVAGPEQINAFGYNNTINANGGSGTINAGQGQATVNAGGGSLTINLDGYNDTVLGGDGNDTLTGSQGNTAVTLGNGNDVIQFAGYSNHITVGNGNDSIIAGAGNSTVTGGSGTDTVQLQGYSNTVTFNGGNDTITGGQGSDVFNLTGGSASLALHGSNEMVFLQGTSATIDDQGSGLAVSVSGGGTDVIQNFASDSSGYVDLLGGIGGYSNASQVLAALTPDGNGGTMLALGSSGSIDFAGISGSQLHASNFHFN